MIREKISTKTTARPKVSPLNPRLKGTITFTKKYVSAYPSIIVKMIAGNPAGITQTIQKMPHNIMVLFETFLS